MLFISYQKSFLVILASLLFIFNLDAKLYFSSMSSSIVLNSVDSHFKISNVDQIRGWDQQSIVRASGFNNAWISDNTIYGDSVGEIVPPDHLIYNNSRAIFTECEHFIHDGLGKLTVLGGIIGETRVRGRGILLSPINLSGATLTNGGDILFSSKTEFIAPGGYLNPRGYAYILGGDMILPDGTDLYLTSSGIFDGQGHSLIFEGDSKIWLDPNITVTFRNINLQNLKDCSGAGSICMVASSSKCYLVFENTKLNLSDTFSFTAGHLCIHGDVIISGSSQFNFTSTHNAYIAKDSKLTLDLGVTFSYGPISADRELIKMYDETSILFLNGCTVNSTTTGLTLKKGTLILDNKNYLYNQDWVGHPATSLSQAVVLGDADPDNSLTIEFLPGGSLDVKSGILDYRNRY